MAHYYGQKAVSGNRALVSPMASSVSMARYGGNKQSMTLLYEYRDREERGGRHLSTCSRGLLLQNVMQVIPNE